MLAEETTTELHRDRDSQGIKPLKKDARDGGAVAGRTRKDIESQTGKPVISVRNFKQLAARKPKKPVGCGEERTASIEIPKHSTTSKTNG